MTSRILRGHTCTVIHETTSSAGTTTRTAISEGDELIVSVWVGSITGTLSVEVWTVDDTGAEKKVYEFPAIGTPTAELQIERVNPILSNIKVVATYTGATDYRVTLRPVGSTVNVENLAVEVENELTVDTPTVANVAAPVASTEYSYPLPTGTKFFRLWSRKRGRIQLAYGATTGTTYITYPPGTLYETPPSIDSDASLTIYFQSSKASDTIEIESWA